MQLGKTLGRRPGTFYIGFCGREVPVAFSMDGGKPRYYSSQGGDCPTIIPGMGPTSMRAACIACPIAAQRVKPDVALSAPGQRIYEFELGQEIKAMNKKAVGQTVEEAAKQQALNIEQLKVGQIVRSLRPDEPCTGVVEMVQGDGYYLVLVAVPAIRDDVEDKSSGAAALDPAAWKPGARDKLWFPMSEVQIVVPESEAALAWLAGSPTSENATGDAPVLANVPAELDDTRSVYEKISERSSSVEPFKQICDFIKVTAKRGVVKEWDIVQWLSPGALRVVKAIDREAGKATCVTLEATPRLIEHDLSELKRVALDDMKAALEPIQAELEALLAPFRILKTGIKPAKKTADAAPPKAPAPTASVTSAAAPALAPAPLPAPLPTVAPLPTAVPPAIEATPEAAPAAMAEAVPEAVPAISSTHAAAPAGVAPIVADALPAPVPAVLPPAPAPVPNALPEMNSSTGLPMVPPLQAQTAPQGAPQAAPQAAPQETLQAGVPQEPVQAAPAAEPTGTSLTLPIDLAMATVTGSAAPREDLETVLSRVPGLEGGPSTGGFSWNTGLDQAGSCWRRAYYEFVLGAVPKFRPDFFSLGTLGHACFELHYRTSGARTWEPIEAARAAGYTELAADVKRYVYASLSKYGEKERRDWDIRGVELQVTWFAGPFKILGKKTFIPITSRIDLVYRTREPYGPTLPYGEPSPNGVTFLDYKFLRSISTKTLHTYANSGQFKTNAIAYNNSGAAEEYGKLNGVTAHMIAKHKDMKPSSIQRVTANTTKDALDEFEHLEAIPNAIALYTRLADKNSRNDPRSWPRNHTSCMGQYGVCPYYDVCDIGLARADRVLADDFRVDQSRIKKVEEFAQPPAEIKRSAGKTIEELSAAEENRKHKKMLRESFKKTSLDVLVGAMADRFPAANYLGTGIPQRIVIKNLQESLKAYWGQMLGQEFQLPVGTVVGLGEDLTASFKITSRGFSVACDGGIQRVKTTLGWKAITTALSDTWWDVALNAPSTADNPQQV